MPRMRCDDGTVRYVCVACGWKSDPDASASWCLPCARRFARASKERIRSKYASGDLKAKQMRAVAEACGSKCAHCGVAVKCEFKKSHPTGFRHKIPLNEGGEHTESNIEVCCHSCAIERIKKAKRNKTSATPK